jgi:hypothetical protein
MLCRFKIKGNFYIILYRMKNLQMQVFLLSYCNCDIHQVPKIPEDRHPIFNLIMSYHEAFHFIINCYCCN